MSTASTDTNVSPADTLASLGLDRGHSAVCGLQYGDEGKGQIVDMLTHAFDYVVRYNGGNNAGHSVHIGDKKFALHLLPSGILSPDKVNVIGNGVVLDPPGILKEIDTLSQAGVTFGSNLRISDRAHVVFPYHKLQDALYDNAVGKARGDDSKIGTTGRGIGPCYADKALRSTAIRVGELLDHDLLREKLAYVVRIKNLMLATLAEECSEVYVPYDADKLADEYIAYAERLAPFICDTTVLLQTAIEGGEQLLFEGANATLLDVDHGTYPFVTSSSCASLGVYPGAGVPGGTLKNVIGIVKLYTSRVGGGPFPSELDDATGDTIRKNGNEFGTTTGRPRRTGWIDLVATRYTTAISGTTALACTGLSVLAGLPQIKACVGYKVGGKTVDTFPADVRVLEKAEPVYETFEGFEGPVDKTTSYADLPAQARRYVEFVEETVRTPIRMVCVGRRRDQILVR